MKKLKSIITRQRHTQALRLRLKFLLLICAGSALAAFIIFLIYGSVGTPNQARASTNETLDSGSYIVNMGIIPQTYSNGLKPYGLVYDLIVNYSTPVKWIIEPAKARDGIDFNYNGVAYKGGPFIIPAAYITATIKTRITYWQTQGVQGVYTTSSVTVPVYLTITNVPKIIIDNTSNKENIVMGYFTNAGIPSSAYSLGMPDSLSTCHDLWLNPHGDPVWATHGRLYSFAANEGSFIWSQCHASSVMEGCTNPSPPYQQLNFLTTNGLKCYSSGKCAPGSTETHSGNPNTPYISYYSADPVMQFMGTMDGACDGGSEKWYQPQSTGQWRATTKVLVATSDGASPLQGALLVYGPAFGLDGKGWAMYEGGHDLDGNGTIMEKVAAQRALFNYVFFSGMMKQLKISNVSVPSTVRSMETNSLSLSVSSGTPGYSYQWSSSVGGTFNNANAAVTNFTAPLVSSITNGIFTCVVTDLCGRRNFISRPFIITPSPLPVSLLDFTVAVNQNSNTVELNWKTAAEKNNDYFTIERTKDGKNFSELAMVNGAGNSNVIKRYSFTDDRPLTGTSYYRLKQTDFNGDFETFKMLPVTLNFNSGKTILVYPNPFVHSFTADFVTAEENEVQISIYNLNGAVIFTEKIWATKGMNTYQFSSGESLNPGTYIIKVNNKTSAIGLAKITKRSFSN